LETTPEKMKKITTEDFLLQRIEDLETEVETLKNREQQVTVKKEPETLTQCLEIFREAHCPMMEGTGRYELSDVEKQVRQAIEGIPGMEKDGDNYIYKID
jgi:hypothetical protein